MPLIDSIKEILFPWTEKHKEQKKADEEKFAELLQILSPTDINSWCVDLHNASYRRNNISLIDNYGAFVERQDTYFFRKKLQKEYKAFNETFSALRAFLLRNFFVNANNTNFYELYPEIRTNNPQQYAERLQELRHLVDKFQQRYAKLVRCGRDKYISLTSLVIPLLLIIGGIVFIFGRSESFIAEFPSSGYDLENKLPTTVRVGFEGTIKNISSQSRYLETMNYVLWEDKTLGKTLGYGGGVGYVYLVNGNEFATITTPILFAPNESKHLNWRYTIDISEQKELDFFLEMQGEGVFAWHKNSPELLMKDSRGNLFDSEGKIVSQEVIDAWWVFPNNRDTYSKTLASLDLWFKVVKWKIYRFFNFQT